MGLRLNKTLTRSVTAVGLVALSLIAWGLWSAWTSAGRLEARLAAIRAAGDPTTIADFGPGDRPLPDPAPASDSNADALLESAAPRVIALDTAIAKLDPKSGRPAGPLDADSLAALEGVFAAHPDVVPRLMEAASRPDYDHRFTATSTAARFTQEVIDRTGRFRSMARVLESWSAVQRARGDRDGALAAAIASLRLAEYLGRGPGLMSTLAAVACGYVAVQDAAETLIAGPVSEVSRRALDAESARYDGPRLLAHALKTERAFSVTSFREMPRWPLPFSGWMVDGAVLMFLDLYEQELANVDLDYRRAQEASTAIVTNLPLHPLRMMAVQIAPALQSLRDAVTRRTAVNRSLRVLNALQRLGLDAPPVDLAGLGLPPGETMDPFTGRPLIVKRSPEGWVVYSVGTNLVDDGGTFHKVLDAGVGPAAP